MANIKQQKKRILVAERQRMENIRYRSSIKTAFRRLIDAVQSGDADQVSAAHQAYVALVDKATAKKALHPNTASRKKSRATRVIARGPQVVETKKRRVSKKQATKAAAPAAAETPAEEAPAEVEEAPADEAPAAEADEAPTAEADEAPAAEADEAPAAEADEAAAEDAAEPAAEADADDAS